MTYDEFKEKLLEEMEERLGKPDVKIITVTKNNNVQKDAVTLSNCEAELNPVVYLDDLYKECVAGKEISECVDQILELSANSHFLRTAGPHFPDSPGHIKRTAWDISRAEGTPPH